MLDSNKQPFDGAKTYKVTLPKDIPESNFLSLTLYDNMRHSMLDTQRRPSTPLPLIDARLTAIYPRLHESSCCIR